MFLVESLVATCTARVVATCYTPVAQVWVTQMCIRAWKEARQHEWGVAETFLVGCS